MTISASGAEATAALLESLSQAERFAEPYAHWIARRVFSETIAATLNGLPIATAGTEGVSGKRELHNDTRQYFDAANMARFPACAAVAEAFQSSAVARRIETLMKTDLTGTYVRLEYAQDVDGFWLEPHTDLGVKRFTMLIYLNAEGARQADLGTDLFADASTWAKAPPFDDNTALIFVPGDNTWHGLRKRPIAGVRRSVIMNYVTRDWRAPRTAGLSGYAGSGLSGPFGEESPDHPGRLFGGVHRFGRARIVGIAGEATDPAAFHQHPQEPGMAGEAEVEDIHRSRGRDRLGDHRDAVPRHDQAVGETEDGAVGVVPLQVPQEHRWIVAIGSLQKRANGRGCPPRGCDRET